MNFPICEWALICLNQQSQPIQRLQLWPWSMVHESEWQIWIYSVGCILLVTPPNLSLSSAGVIVGAVGWVGTADIEPPWPPEEKRNRQRTWSSKGHRQSKHMIKMCHIYWGCFGDSSIGGAESRVGICIRSTVYYDLESGNSKYS